MGKIKIWFFCAVLSFSFLTPVFSETIILKSGLKVEGRITEETDKYAKIDFEGVELTFYSDEIFSIDRSSAGGTGGVSPQLEMLYKAYTAAKNSSGVSGKKDNKGNEAGVSEEEKDEKAEIVKRNRVSSSDFSTPTKDKKIKVWSRSDKD